MSNAKKQPSPKINPYWIYGFVIALLLGMSLFGGDNDWQNLNKINISEFERYLNEGDVSEVVVVNKNLARITLKKDALNKKIHERVTKKNFLGQENSEGPHYQFEVGNLELFQRKLEKAENNKVAFNYEFVTLENRWMDFSVSYPSS